MQPTLCTKANLNLTELTVRLESQLYLRRKGAREDRCWVQTPTVPTAALHLWCLGKRNYISQEAVRPPPRPAPAFLLPGPAPLRDPLVYKGRMARPWAERGGGTGARCAGGAGWTRPPKRAPSDLPFPLRACPSPRAPTLRCLGPADLQTRGRERICPWCFPRAWLRGSGGNLGSRWRCAAKEGEKLRPGWVLSQCEEAERARQGPRSAPHPPPWCAAPRARECGNLGIPASELPAMSAGPEHRGRRPALWLWMESEAWGGGLRTP